MVLEGKKGVYRVQIDSTAWKVDSTECVGPARRYLEYAKMFVRSYPKASAPAHSRCTARTL